MVTTTVVKYLKVDFCMNAIFGCYNIPVYITATVAFSDDPGDMKEPDFPTVETVCFPKSGKPNEREEIAFYALPTLMQKAIEAQAVTVAYDRLNAETVAAI